MKIHGNLGDRAGLGPLKRALQAYALRHRVSAANIANAEVPGYTPKRVRFEDALAASLEGRREVAVVRTHPRHLEGTKTSEPVPRVVTDSESQGVDLEKEMVAMVENQLAYRLAVRLLEMKYRQLHSAIRGTSR